MRENDGLYRRMHAKIKIKAANATNSAMAISMPNPM